MMCNKMGIDIWSVIDAAKTKPFGFMPFYPGPGLGGHCIPIDPFYFSWKAKQYGLEPRFIETAGYINAQMPHYVVQKVQDALNTEKRSLNGSRIHIMGVAYKKDIDDVRESPAVDVALLLAEKGAEITYYDPYVPTLRVNGHVFTSVAAPTGKTFKYKHEIDDPYLEALYSADCVVILTNHSSVDYAALLDWSDLIVDTRNAMHGLTDPKIVRL
jgi:UDP-N-acetyl-D-glucosamine dehydrogenase